MLSASSVKRLASQRLHLGRNEVSDWLDARHSTFVRLGVNEPKYFWKYCDERVNEIVSALERDGEDSVLFIMLTRIEKKW
ncbi:hypothetical protein TNCV_1496691 [Trichonephila clavipes]|nr:hypothetical protein TNCV_1496691 [Trichonephila clavipes]